MMRSKILSVAFAGLMFSACATITYDLGKTAGDKTEESDTMPVDISQHCDGGNVAQVRVDQNIIGKEKATITCAGGEVAEPAAPGNEVEEPAVPAKPAKKVGKKPAKKKQAKKAVKGKKKK